MSRAPVESFNEYQSLAILTLNRKEFLDNVLHCVMGMAGEVGEFMELSHENHDKRVGEIGDCLWYSAVLSNELCLSFDSIMLAANAKAAMPSEFNVSTSEQVASIWAARLIDRVKKSVFYGRALDCPMVTAELIGYCSALINMAAKMATPLLWVAETNIKKLEARYPDKVFNADHANNRNYEVESAAAGVPIV